VLAQSQLGIRETILDSLIRDWLQHRQIKADIHKEVRRESSAHLPTMAKGTINLRPADAPAGPSPAADQGPSS
jgi:hypothetical protein